MMHAIRIIVHVCCTLHDLHSEDLAALAFGHNAVSLQGAVMTFNTSDTYLTDSADSRFFGGDTITSAEERVGGGGSVE